MKAYSNDLRLKIVSACERGRRSQREIAELFGVSPAPVGRPCGARSSGCRAKKAAPRLRAGHAAGRGGALH